MTMKKKILSLCLVVALAATAVIGGTLAYFSDTDAQKNTFTTGNVAIDLWEDFGDNDKEKGIEELIPAVITKNNDGSDSVKNGIEKEVYVDNIGSEDAYVRVHIAIPSILDGGDTTFDGKVLHFDYTKDSVGNGKWSWTTGTDDTPAYQYITTIDSIPYNVYVVTYGTALKHNGSTVDAISQVYLDPMVTNENIDRIKNGDVENGIAGLGNNWYIYVAAEGTQAAGFDDADTALNTAFGNPTDSAYTSQIDWKTVSGKDWKDND